MALDNLSEDLFQAKHCYLSTDIIPGFYFDNSKFYSCQNNCIKCSNISINQKFINSGKSNIIAHVFRLKQGDDLFNSIKEIVKEKNTRLYLTSFILGKEITHSQIWIFTPLLVLVGVPIEIISLGWILNQLMRILGSKISEKMINYNTSKKFIIPIIIEIIWMLIIDVSEENLHI